MQLREIKDKISTVNNISKITKALETVSAVKMRKAQDLALNSRPFTSEIIKILMILKRISEKERISFEWLKGGEKKVLAVILTSDKGFCGAFNTNVIKFALDEIEKISNGDDGLLDVSITIA
jgi:F-type H+-transporting ATPase subunit gamma